MIWQIQLSKNNKSFVNLREAFVFLSGKKLKHLNAKDSK
jgi:hypothetical protein